MVKGIALAFLVSLSLVVAAESPLPLRTLGNTLVISDIDDTIQLTEVRRQGPRIIHWWRLTKNFFRSHDAFIGLPALYQSMAVDGAEIHYVSGAPKMISKFPKKFLESSQFPVGQLWVRPSLKIPTFDFKLITIAGILRANPTKAVILIGDNGEKDVQVYDELQRDPEFANRIKFVFIHRLYGTPPGTAPAENQKIYMTAADLGLHLWRDYLITSGQFEYILEQVDRGLRSPFASIRDRSLPYFSKLEVSDLDNLKAAAELHGKKHPKIAAKLLSIAGHLEKGWLCPKLLEAIANRST